MRKGDKVHFIGIGGAGMSGIAEIFCCHGYKVQGSDVHKTKVTDRLQSIGIDVAFGHSPENIHGADYVVYSSCIKEANVEIIEAKKNNIPLLRRMEALRLLVEDKDVIAVSGAHGKTTTTSLISFLAVQAGLDPTLFIGADVDFLKGNARCGKSLLVVTEADESDGSFLLVNPLYSVITNIDKEHMDYYKDMDYLISSYKRFIDNTKDNGAVFICADDPYLKNIIKPRSKRIVKYGLYSDADVRAEGIKHFGLKGSEFDLVVNGRVIDRIRISLTGVHNVVNSLAAIAVAMELGISLSHIKDTIQNFKGVDRRYRVLTLPSDIMVIDDYAHHPTEIKAVLKTFEGSGRRIVVVFQPHRYSRTKDLKEEFGRAFGLADHLVITDIYSAYEQPIDKVSANDICESARINGHRNVHFVAKDFIIPHLRKVVTPGDIVFVLGAGDIGEMPDRIAGAIEEEMSVRA